MQGSVSESLNDFYDRIAAWADRWESWGQIILWCAVTYGLYIGCKLTQFAITKWFFKRSDPEDWGAEFTGLAFLVLAAVAFLFVVGPGLARYFT